MTADYISRQAAMNAFAERVKRSNNSDFAPVPRWNDAVEIVENLPSADVPHWIPCSERLPEEDGQYLITVKYKHVNDNYEDVYAEHGEWYEGRWDMFCFGHCGEVEDIIAWMPLPKPWKGEQNG